MAVDFSDETIKKYAEEFTMEVNASVTGESPEIEMLKNIRESMGDSKLFDDPHFFFWSFKIPPTTFEFYGYDIDEIDNRITFYSVDFGEPGHQVVKETVDKLGNRATNFFRAVINDNRQILETVDNEALDLCDEIRTLNKTPEGIPKISVIIVSNGISSLRNRENKPSIKNLNIDVDYILWDIKWIYENCKLEKEHESIVLDFKDEELAQLVNGGIPFLEVPQPEACFDCYQCVVPGKLLSKIYREYGSPLLEGNVRSFLSAKTDVNKKIQGTIQKEPKRFYIYNNGIAAVASEVEVSIVHGISMITRINDIQIINGGQTTASLAYAERKRGFDLSDIFVPMKLTIIKKVDDKVDNSAELIQKISKTSNSQNKVSDADFFANHPFHTAMKNFSLDYPVIGTQFNKYWFYERARGEYAQEMLFRSDSWKVSFQKKHPKSMYLTKTDFAKFYSLLTGHPDLASKGSATNFKAFAKEIDKTYEEGKEAKYDIIFFKEVTGVAKIYRTLEPQIKEQPWFEGSYRANALNYGISLFFDILKRQFPNKTMDLTIIWDKDIPYGLSNQLIELCRMAYEHLTDDNRKVVNVTQWAKQAECWKSMKEKYIDYELDEARIGKLLVDTTSYLEKRRACKKDNQIVIDVDAYRKVFDSDHIKVWPLLYEFVYNNSQYFKDLSQYDYKSLGIMKNVAQNVGREIPDAKMCTRVLEILEAAEIYGFSS